MAEPQLLSLLLPVELLSGGLNTTMLSMVVRLGLPHTVLIDGKVFRISKPDGGLVLKRLIRDYYPAVCGQAWIMRSDNPDKVSHPDKDLPPDDRTMVVGTAVWNDIAFDYMVGPAVLLLVSATCAIIKLTIPGG